MFKRLKSENNGNSNEFFPQHPRPSRIRIEGQTAQYCKLCDEGDGKNYLPVKVGNNTKPVWAHVNDINEYKLESWK